MRKRFESNIRIPKWTGRGLVLFVVLFGASLAVAQLTRGTISGTVTDQSGAAVPGAAITITNTDTGSVRQSETGATGRYEAPNLPVGNYDVSAQLTGFQTSVRAGIGLSVGRTALVDIVLQVGEVAQAVTVTGEATFVETTSATVSQLVEQQKVEDLPLNNRDLTELSFLQPGVLRIPQRQGQSAFSGMGQKISVAGSRATQNIFMLDGVAAGDLSGNVQGASGSYIGAETVKEFQIITNNYSAEYKSQAGAIISAVTKSGTNTLHGSLFETLRNDNFDAAKWEDNAFGEKPEFKRNQFGGSIGGPIVSDRTFFFGSYEGLRERLSTTDIQRVFSADVHKGIIPGQDPIEIDPDIKPYLALYPIPGTMFPQVHDFGDGTVRISGAGQQPTTDDFVAFKIDHTLSDNNLLSGTYNFNESERSPFGILGDLGAQGISNRRHTISTGLTSILSPTVLNEFNFGYTFSEVVDDAVLSTRDFGGLPFHPDRTLVGQINPGEEATSVGYRTAGSFYTSKGLTFKDGLSLTRGNHSFRLGVDINRFRYNQFSCSKGCNGVWEFSTTKDFLTNTVDRFEIYIPGHDSPKRNMNQIIFGSYFQDNWRVSNSLTLNLGMRYEFATVISEDDMQISNLVNYQDPNVSVPASIAPKFPDEEFAGTIDQLYTNATLRSFSPRFGFAWSPADRKTSLRGGFGIFYEHPTLFNIRTALQELPPFVLVGRARSRDAKKAGVNLRMFHQNAAGQFPVEVYEDLLKGRPSMRYMEHAQQTANILRWSLTLQREVAEWVLSAGYTGSRAQHLWVQTLSNINRWDGWPNNPAPGTRKHFSDGADPINDNFGEVRTQSPNGNSFYQGLALSAQKRISRGFQTQISYNFSKAIDNGAGVTNNGENLPQGLRGVYYWDMDQKRSLSKQDIRHSFVSNFSYEFPRGDFGGVGNALVNGWQINGIVTLLSGHPLGIYDLSGIQRDLIGDDDKIRPNLIPGGDNSPVLGGPDKYFDTSQFVPSVCAGSTICQEGDPDFQPGFYGNLGNNTLISPGLATFDFSLLKDFDVSENNRVQFRAEFFNLFNRPNFGAPETDIFTRSGGLDKNAGRIEETITSARQIQFGLKFIF